MRKFLPAIAIALVALTLPGAVQAQENSVEVTPFVGYRFANSLNVNFETPIGVNINEDITLKNGISYGFVLGVPVSDYITIEGTYSYRSNDIRVKTQNDFVLGDGTAQYIHGGAAFTVNPYSRGARWFLSLSAGVGMFSADNTQFETDSSTRFSFGFGAGVKVPMSDSIALRAEFRGYSTSTSLTSLGWICGWYTCGLVEGNQYFWEGEARVGLQFGF